MVTHMIKKFFAGASCLVLLVGITACGKNVESTEKTAEQTKSERDASMEKAKQSVVFGDQLKALDKAKATADEAAKVAAERMKKAEQ